MCEVLHSLNVILAGGSAGQQEQIPGLRLPTQSPQTPKHPSFIPQSSYGRERVPHKPRLSELLLQTNAVSMAVLMVEYQGLKENCWEVMLLRSRAYPESHKCRDARAWVDSSSGLVWTLPGSMRSSHWWMQGSWSHQIQLFNPTNALLSALIEYSFAQSVSLYPVVPQQP